MEPDVNLYFIRHGETDWNAEGRYQGQRDIPINARGRLQAQRNGEVLGEAVPDLTGLRFVASPLTRTRQTMEIVRSAIGLAEQGYATDQRLVELSYGEWEGMLASDLERTDAANVAARRQRPFDWRPVAGESYRDLSERLRPWAESIGQDMVVVSHGGVGKALRGLLLEIAPHEIPRLPAPQDRILLLQRSGGAWRQSWL